MYDQVVKCQRAGLCLSEHFLIYSLFQPVTLSMWAFSTVCQVYSIHLILRAGYTPAAWYTVSYVLPSQLPTAFTWGILASGFIISDDCMQTPTALYALSCRWRCWVIEVERSRSSALRRNTSSIRDSRSTFTRRSALWWTPDRRLSPGMTPNGELTALHAPQNIHMLKL